MLREQFENVLREFGQSFTDDLSFNEDNNAVITVDEDIIINITYLEESDYVLLHAPVGGYLKNEDKDGAQALSLLRLNDICALTYGISLMLDESNAMIMAADRRSVMDITTRDALAAWVNAMVDAIHKVRGYFAENFPVDSQED